jgi:hypothetical protein
MKKIILLLVVSFFSLLLPCQSDKKIYVGGVIRMNVSRLKIRDPLSTRQTYQPTGYAYTPGFGIAVQPYAGKIFHLFVQLAYEERGSSESYYFATSNNNDFLHIYDRFRCAYLDILLRAQNQKGVYFGIGGSICKPIKGYYRHSSSTTVLPQGSIIHEPTEISSLTYGITMATGINLSGKTDFELNSTWDVSPVISRSDATVLIWVASFTVRYYLIRPDSK